MFPTSVSHPHVDGLVSSCLHVGGFVCRWRPQAEAFVAPAAAGRSMTMSSLSQVSLS